VWTVPLRTKSGKEMVDALKRIFDEGRKPTRIRSDKGTEICQQRRQEVSKGERGGLFRHAKSRQGFVCREGHQDHQIETQSLHGSPSNRSLPRVTTAPIIVSSRKHPVE